MALSNVDVIILHYNGKENIDNCLKSVKKTTYPNFSIILIDNNSTDDSVEFIKKNYPEIKFIENSSNLGYAGGNNAALRISKAKYSVLLNDDTIVEPEWLAELVNAAEKDEMIATLQPKVRSLRNKKNFDNCAAGCFLDIYGYPIYRGRVFETVEEDAGQYDNPSEIFLSVGVCMFIRMSALKESGLLDEDFHIYFEEFDLCWRMSLLGYKHISIPSSVIFHIGGVTYKKKSYRWSYLNHRNSIIVLIKNYSGWNLMKRLPVRIILEFFSLIGFLAKLDFERASANFMALLWIFTHPRMLAKKRKEIQSIRKVSDEEITKNMVQKSVVAQYYIFRRKYFKDYIQFIPSLQEPKK